MKRILLGYDGSPSAQRALARTTEIALETASPVVVVSIAPTHEYAVHGPASNGSTGATSAHGELAKDAVAQLAEHGVTAQALAGVGPPAETLIELADATEAEVIVVGMSSRDLVSRVVGGVSDGVARDAHCDVVVVY